MSDLCLDNAMSLTLRTYIKMSDLCVDNVTSLTFRTYINE